MCKTLLGRKLGMTQIFADDDTIVPVTVIQAGPCTITQIKTAEKEGYEAIQIGYGLIKPNKVNQPMKGHFNKGGVEPSRVLREVRVDSTSTYELGQQITVEAFAEAKSVDVSGISKGKGFAGVIKRYNFRGGPGSHGAHFHRAPGSIGQCATPSRVFKGLKLPGHMGSEKVTVKNLDVIKVDTEQNLLLVRGAVPGGKGALLTIRTNK
ncbi:MAG: 50S ribosomal protein L3 [Coriobacteriales bacterium]|jgi:large subunit ribosomal protein L3|nr:50S ribosomal protein L3 [Coriobacteriales bacterium]